MIRLSPLLLKLLQKLLTFVSGSVRRLLLLLPFIRHRLSKKGSSHGQDISRIFIPPASQSSHINGLPARGAICPSLQPPSGDNGSSNAPRSLHAPILQRGYILPYAYDGQGSRSAHEMAAFQDSNIETSTHEEQNPGPISISTHPVLEPPSLPVSPPSPHHSLVLNSSRPDSPVSQPVRVSRPPTPASANMALPAGALPSLRTMEPMSTASVQRYNRNITVYVLTRVRLHR
jgi:hypothetical protein